MKHLMMTVLFFGLASCSVIQERLSTLSRPAAEPVATPACDPAARAELDQINQRLELGPISTGAPTEITVLNSDIRGTPTELICVSLDSGLVRCTGLAEAASKVAAPQPVLFDLFERRQELLATLYSCQ